MQKPLIIFILASAIVLQVGIAAEIDSVTPRKVKLNNSINRINEIFDQRIEIGIQNANVHNDIEANEFCDEDILFTELRKAIFHSLTASWGLKGYELDLQLRSLLARDSYVLALNDSIYRDINYLEGFSLNLKGLSHVVNIDGHLVGLDKIGHFFAEGWKYFELTYFDGQSFDQALEWGKQQEAGKFGYTTTGIFSFSDLVANFNGWRFWNKVLLKQDDPIKGFFGNLFNRPYVTCEIQFIASIKNRKIVKAWEYNTQIDFSDYIDGTFDEGNNCSSYADPIIEEKITSRIKNVDPDFNCPLKKEYCVESQEKYGIYAKHVLHPYCLIAT